MFRIGSLVCKTGMKKFPLVKVNNNSVLVNKASKFNSRLFSTPAADPNKAARLARMQAKGTAGPLPPTANRQLPIKKLLALLGAVGIVGSVYELNTNKEGKLYSLYKDTPLQSLVAWIVENTWGSFKEVFYPANDKLLPDWPTAPCYGNPFPGTPAPPVLVLSLEKVLVGSVYDAKHGWRHVKRPGADKFIEALQNYYEVVLFSETDRNNMVEVFEAIDKTGMRWTIRRQLPVSDVVCCMLYVAGHCHKFGSSEGEIRNGVTLKRLDIMNRDVGRILLIDHSKEASALFPRNTLLVKPFEDIYDTTDRALLDLIPVLQGFIHEDVQDFRQVLDNLGTHIASEAVEEYEMR
jgi:hypothetical protein